MLTSSTTVSLFSIFPAPLTHEYLISGPPTNMVAACVVPATAVRSRRRSQQRSSESVKLQVHNDRSDYPDHLSNLDDVSCAAWALTLSCFVIVESLAFYRNLGRKTLEDGSLQTNGRLLRTPCTERDGYFLVHTTVDQHVVLQEFVSSFRNLGTTSPVQRDSAKILRDSTAEPEVPVCNTCVTLVHSPNRTRDVVLGVSMDSQVSSYGFLSHCLRLG